MVDHYVSYWNDTPKYNNNFDIEGGYELSDDINFTEFLTKVGSMFDDETTNSSVDSKKGSYEQTPREIYSEIEGGEDDVYVIMPRPIDYNCDKFNPTTRRYTMFDNKTSSTVKRELSRLYTDYYKYYGSDGSDDENSAEDLNKTEDSEDETSEITYMGKAQENTDIFDDLITPNNSPKDLNINNLTIKSGSKDDSCKTNILTDLELINECKKFDYCEYLNAREINKMK